jgi:peptidoglycan/xylan/chitin deacetylase (PgdA/CDA1 family)
MMPDTVPQRPLRPRADARRIGVAAYYAGLRALGLPALRRRWFDADVVLCYHNVVAGDDPASGEPGLHMRRDRFARQLEWLARHYRIVSLREFVARDRTRVSRPLAAITFDDAYAGVFEHAVPLLRGLGIPATVFVVAEAAGRGTGFWWDEPDVIASLTPTRRDRWLTHLRGDGAAILSEAQVAATTPASPACRPADWATIRNHADTIDLGAHSATHRFLPALTDDELEREVVESRRRIYEETGQWPEFFAYPYGACDARVSAAARSVGYRAAFGLEASPTTAEDRWCLSRLNVPSDISDAAFEAWTAGLQPRHAN